MKRHLETKTVQTIAAVLSLLSFVLVIGCVQPGSTPGANEAQRVPGLLERIESTGELHAGYGVYPPYTSEDPNTGAVSGFSVDIVHSIAKQLNAELVWHRLNWNTMAADLKRGQFDLIADPIFQTIPRAREFAFSDPYAYFADGIAVVREGDERFTSFEDLNSEELTIAVGQGWASETIVRNYLPNARIRAVQTSTDLLQVFNEVLAERADVAVADAADALRYVNEHPQQVDALFVDEPPVWIPAGFALRPDDHEGAVFLNVALRYLNSIGTIDALADQYDVQINAP